MEKLIVGCGYLGRRVATCWVAQGHRIWATTRSTAHSTELQQLGVMPILCDVLDPDSVGKIPLAEAALYCIGLDRATGASMRQVYVEGLANFLSKAPAAKRLIYVSSSSVYGQCRGELVDEQLVADPLEPAGQVVLEAEQVLRQFRPDAIILRFAGIYGPGRLLRSRTIRAGEPIVGDPEKWLNLIHVDDGVRAVCAAEVLGQAGEVYIVSDGAAVQRHDFYRELARLLGAPTPRWQAPAVSDPLPPHERANRRLSNRRLRQELQVELGYPSYREGLRAAVAEDPGS